MRVIMAGVAAIALAATGVSAQGNGKGQGNEKSAAQANENPGKGKQSAGNQGGNKKADAGPQRVGPAERRDGSPGNARPERDNGRDNDFRVRYEDRGPRRNDDRDIRIGVGDVAFDWLVQDRSRDFIPGCPPGLAKKRNGCNPPGQVKDRYARSPYGFDYRLGLFGLDGYDRRGNYYYNDGYLVRFGDGGGIASWIPLLGGALAIGNIWPSSYQSYRVPDYYVDYYDLGGPDRYRYADNVIYRVNPEDAAIVSIAALITGDEFRIGQTMPRGYDVYNVPYGYRDRYYDTPEYMYRYSDGYVYQIDPETRLVAAAIDLLI